MISLAHLLRKLGRSRKSPVRATKCDDGTIKHEEFKADHHQQALWVTISPLIVLLLGAKDFDSITDGWLKLTATLLVLFTSFSALLRVALIAVSRNRIRLLIRGQSEGKKSIKLFFISLNVQNWSEWLAVAGFGAMAAFLLRAIWI
jgi:hypothetical protein